MTLHPFHLLTQKQRTREENALLAAIIVLSTKQGFTNLTFERIYDWLIEFNFDVPQTFAPANHETEVPQKVTNGK